MKHFDKNDNIKLVTEILNSIPESSRGPQDCILAGLARMHKIMSDEANDLRAEIDRLTKPVPPNDWS